MNHGIVKIMVDPDYPMYSAEHLIVQVHMKSNTYTTFALSITADYFENLHDMSVSVNDMNQKRFMIQTNM